MKRKSLTKNQIEKLKSKLNDCIDFINSHEIYIKELPAYKEELYNCLQAKGFSLVKITNLAEQIKIEEFCDNNNLEIR